MNGRKMSRMMAEHLAEKLNRLLKINPLADAVMSDEYEVLRRQFDGSRWGVIVDSMENVDGKIYASLKIVQKDSHEYERCVSGKEMM